MTLHAALDIISRFVDLCSVFWRATVYEAAAKRVRSIFRAVGLIFGQDQVSGHPWADDFLFHNMGSDFKELVERQVLRRPSGAF